MRRTTGAAITPTLPVGAFHQRTYHLSTAARSLSCSSVVSCVADEAPLLETSSLTERYCPETISEAMPIFRLTMIPSCPLRWPTREADGLMTSDMLRDFVRTYVQAPTREFQVALISSEELPIAG